MQEVPSTVYVVNCTKDLPMHTEQGHRLPVNDDRSLQSMTDMRKHLDTAVDMVYTALNNSHVVYVHCNAGRYRSPTVVVAYLIKYKGVTLEDAIAHVMTCKRDAFFYEHHFMEVLQDYFSTAGGGRLNPEN